MKKRLFATLLALVMALGLTVTAAADETDLNGWLDTESTTTVEVTYWYDASNNPGFVSVTGYDLGNGSYKLTGDLTIAAPLIVTGTVTLDLNGHTLTYNGTAQNSVIVVKDSAHFTLMDSSSGGKITGGTGTKWSVSYYGIQQLHHCGGGVFVGSKATFNMTGGSIVDCSVNDAMGRCGGGVYLASGTGDSRTTFTMTGGSIVRCNSGSDGGGVYADENTNFTMKGGRIADCTASTGGGVYSLDTFAMEGGIIEDCTAATAYGSALYGSSGAMDAQGGCVRGAVGMDHDCNLKNDSSTGSTIFYGDVEKNINVGGQFFAAFTDNLVTFKNGETTYARTFFKGGGGKISQPDAPTAPEGKIFAGWYTAETGGNKWIFDTDTVSSNMTLYAQWHDLTEVPAKGATCTEPGNRQHWKCEDCGKLFADNTGATEITAEAMTIPATDHESPLTHVPAKPATRQEAGNIEYWQCSGCKQCFADEAGQTPIDQADTVIAKLPPRKNNSTATTTETVTSPNTTDPGVLLTSALSVVSLLGMGYVGKKR